MTAKRKTLAVDFDGVLHLYTTEWSGIDIIPDPPVPGAVEFITAAVKRFDIVVFSVRADSGPGRVAIQTWLKQHGFPEVRVTALKPKAHVYLDDRGWRFEGTFPSVEELAAFKPWNRR